MGKVRSTESELEATGCQQDSGRPYPSLTPARPETLPQKSRACSWEKGPLCPFPGLCPGPLGPFPGLPPSLDSAHHTETPGKAGTDGPPPDLPQRPPLVGSQGRDRAWTQAIRTGPTDSLQGVLLGDA